MRGLLLVGLLALTGCASVEGPRQRQIGSQLPVDSYGLTLDEQRQLGRDRYSYPDQTIEPLAPKTFTATPGPHGR